VDAAAPVIGIVSRFAIQKGFDLLEQIAGKLSELNVAVVALGSGEPAYEKFFRDWAFWNKANVSVCASATTTLWRTRSKPAPIFS
jgi:glycogen synthase